MDFPQAGEVHEVPPAGSRRLGTAAATDEDGAPLPIRDHGPLVQSGFGIGVDGDAVSDARAEKSERKRIFI